MSEDNQKNKDIRKNERRIICFISDIASPFVARNIEEELARKLRIHLSGMKDDVCEHQEERKKSKLPEKPKH